MSNLTNLSDYATLANELGVSLQDSFIDRGDYTPFPIPENMRSLIDPHKSDVFSWNPPGIKKERGEDSIVETLYTSPPGSDEDSSDDEGSELNIIHELGGIIVEYSQRDHLAYFTDKLNVTCSVLGYNTGSGPTTALPNVPYKNKFAWVDGKPDYTTPDPAVIALGLVGSRGMSCEDCIRSGSAVQEVEIDGSLKSKSCETRGKLVIAVTEVSRIKRKKTNPKLASEEEKKTYNIRDLYDENGEKFKEPIFISITMAPSFIRGKYNEGIIGYENFIKGLKVKNPDSPAALSLFNFTTIRMKKPEKSPTYQPHFTSRGLAATDLIVKVKSLWDEMRPKYVASPIHIEKSSKLKNVEMMPDLF